MSEGNKQRPEKKVAVESKEKQQKGPENKDKERKKRRRRSRRKRHIEMSKVRRDGLKNVVDDVKEKPQVKKSPGQRNEKKDRDLGDELVEDQPTIIEEEQEVATEKVDQSFEDKKEDVLEGGQKHEETIKREKKKPAIETAGNKVDDDKKQEVVGQPKQIEKKEKKEIEPKPKKQSSAKSDAQAAGQPADEAFDDIFGDDFLVDDEGLDEGSDQAEDLFNDFLVDAATAAVDNPSSGKKSVDQSEQNEVKKQAVKQESKFQSKPKPKLQKPKPQGQPKQEVKQATKKEQHSQAQPVVDKIEKPVKKKKSYLEILKEEAKKFEEMEAKRKGGAKEQSVAKKVEPATELRPREDAGDVDLFGADNQFEEPDWLKPSEDIDGVHADAMARAQKVEAKDEARDKGKKVENVVAEDDLFGDTIFEGNFEDQQSAQATSEVSMMPGKSKSGFHEGKKDELYHGEKAFSQGGMQHGAEIFTGAKDEVEKASEGMTVLESSPTGGIPQGPREGVNEKDKGSIRDAMNEKRFEINEVLEGGGGKDKGSFVNELKSVLSQAGLSWGAVKGFCALGLIVVVLFAGYFFDLHGKIWRLATGLDFWGGDSGQVEEPQPGGAKIGNWPIDGSYRFAGDLYGEAPLPYTVGAGYIFGDPIDLEGVPRHSGVKVGLIFGETAEVRESQRFAYYVEYVGQLRNIYLTDLDQLLDNSRNREQTFEDYRKQLSEMNQRGLALAEEVNVKLSEIKEEFDAVTAAKQEAEEEFFANLESFQGQQSDEALKVFMDLRKQQVDLRAEFNALTRVAEEYEKVLIRIDRRLQALDLNRDALIKGVKVTPIPGSNLDFIEGDE